MGVVVEKAKKFPNAAHEWCSANLPTMFCEDASGKTTLWQHFVVLTRKSSSVRWRAGRKGGQPGATKLVAPISVAAVVAGKNSLWSSGSRQTKCSN